MRSINEVKSDLREIRYYYTFVKGHVKTDEVIPKSTLKKIEEYSQVIENAPIKLFKCYTQLYIEGYTQVGLADKTKYSENYIKLINKELCKYLSEHLD